MVAISPGQHSTCLVRHVGWLSDKPTPDSRIRHSLRARLDEGTTVVAALCGAGNVDAPTVCDGRQSLYALQSDPDRPIRGRGGFDSYFVVRSVEDTMRPPKASVQGRCLPEPRCSSPRLYVLRRN